MTSTLPPTTWSEEDIVIWENMDAATKRKFVLSSALGTSRVRPSEWLENTVPCDECGTVVDADIHAEEFGMCVDCSNEYFNHDEEV